jgi:hypothetical protein
VSRSFKSGRGQIWLDEPNGVPIAPWLSH